MSYSAYFRTLPLSVPQVLGFSLAGYAWINIFNGKPGLWTRQISKSEFNATPNAYLVHPDHNHVAFPAVPGQASVEDELSHLHHKAAHAKGHAHH